MTFLLPACLSNEFYLNPCCLQPKEKGESFRIENREQGFNSTLVFFIVFWVYVSCMSKRTGEGKKSGEGTGNQMGKIVWFWICKVKFLSFYSGLCPSFLSLTSESDPFLAIFICFLENAPFAIRVDSLPTLFLSSLPSESKSAALPTSLPAIMGEFRELQIHQSSKYINYWMSHYMWGSGVVDMTSEETPLKPLWTYDNAGQDWLNVKQGCPKGWSWEHFIIQSDVGFMTDSE